MLRETRTVLKKIDCLISLYLLFLGVFVTSGAFASSVGPEARDFALNIKQAELVFVGTLIDIQYIRVVPDRNNFITDLTFRVDELIEGTPNIDEKTVRFSIPGGKGVDPRTGKMIRHGSTMGANLARLVKDDKVLLLLRKNPYIARWMPRYDGLYTVGPVFGCWHVREDKVVMFGYVKESAEKHPLPKLPLPLYVKLMNAAKKHPERANQLIHETDETLTQAISDGVAADGGAADQINADTIARIQAVLTELDAADEFENPESTERFR